MPLAPHQVIFRRTVGARGGEWAWEGASRLPALGRGRCSGGTGAKADAINLVATASMAIHNIAGEGFL
ncbi:MAG TPA: hypothetical protein VKY19_01620 [Ktedonosporobacter sp.]|jgi:hypothetical protein|nr:hypothetical protein [Ktedonosporobacter sp.]